VTTASETPADDIAALKAALAAERTARQSAEARASGAEAMVAHLKLLIAKLRRGQYGQSAERGRLIATAKLDDIAPQAWLAELLARIADYPVLRLNQPLPWHWKPAQDQAAAA
jgi:hypothetical protein